MAAAVMLTATCCCWAVACSSLQTTTAATVAAICRPTLSDGTRDKRFADHSNMLADDTDLLVNDADLLADHRPCHDHDNRTRVEKLLLRTSDAVSKFLPFVTSADTRTQCFRHTTMYLTQLNDFKLWATKSE